METTKLDRNLRRASIVATATFALLGLQSAAQAQLGQTSPPPLAAAAEPAAAPMPAPAEAEAAPAPPGAEGIPAPPPSYNPQPGYGPPPGYGPHPGYRSRYGYHPGYYQAPRYATPMRSTYRPFMFGVGLGIGSLSYDSTEVVKHEAGISYALHFGFGITPRWMVLLGLDGSWAQFTFGDPAGLTDGSGLYGKRSVALTTYTAGAQFFMLNWLYSRLGLGLACLEWNDSRGDGSDCRGQAAAGGVGAEFLQTYSTSLAVELAATVARFPDAQTVTDRNDIWYNIGVNLVLNLY